MNASEVKKLLAVIAARYPGSKVWDQQPELTVQAWQMTLDDVTYEDAQRVLVAWFKAQRWAPDPSEIRALLAERIAPLPSEGEAWKDGLAWVRGVTVGIEPFGVTVMRRIGNRKELGQWDKDKLREAFGWEFRRVASEERTERVTSVGDLAAANTMRALS